jgi:hypothetical protein
MVTAVTGKKLHIHTAEIPPFSRLSQKAFALPDAPMFEQRDPYRSRDRILKFRPSRNAIRNPLL